MSKTCPICKQRRRLGNCNFGQGGADMGPHCRGCCTAPERDGWKAFPAPRRARARAKARA